MGQDEASGVGARDGEVLLGQGLDDGLGPGAVAFGAVGLELGLDPGPPGLLEGGGGGPGGDHRQDAVMLQPRAQHGLEGGVDLGVQAPDPVGDLVDLAGQVQVEAGEHGQGSGVLVAGCDRPESVRHRALRLGDDLGVTVVSLRVAGGQVSDTPHRQAR